MLVVAVCGRSIPLTVRSLSTNVVAVVDVGGVSSHSLPRRYSYCEEAVGVDLEGPRLCRDFVQRLFQPQHISRIHSATQPEYFLLHLRCFDYLSPVDRHPRACGVSGHRAITIGCNAALKPPGVPPSHQRIRYAD